MSDVFFFGGGLIFTWEGERGFFLDELTKCSLFGLFGVLFLLGFWSSFVCLEGHSARIPWEEGRVWFWLSAPGITAFTGNSFPENQATKRIKQ